MHLAAIAMFCAIATVNIPSAYSQQEQANSSALEGDADLPYPVAQGQPGKSDPTAIAEIEACERASSLPAKRSLEIKGTLLTGKGNDTSGTEVSLVMEGEGQFRMDIRDSEGQERGMRMMGRTGRIIGGPPSIRPPALGEFGDPLMFSMALKSIASGSNVAIVDNGFVVVGSERLHGITVTHFVSSSANHLAKNMGPSQALALYFDPATHLLMKSVTVNHSLTDVTHQYLHVTSYEAYKQVDTIMVPTRYVQTVYGQRVMVLNATEVALSQPHGEAYFK
jgi:hypothetical protein